MMLTETNGLRVQVTSPSLGAASVRVQGLRGRYTQVLADGLPLYGPAGTIGILQIPPMDLGQVEVIKGVASALYGGSALGGVINLISRQPQRNRSEQELLINRTTRGGTDGVAWLSGHGDGNWGYSFLGGGHFQQRNDIDEDGWTDLPSYRRAIARPRFMWEDGSGRSIFFTAGAMAEDRRGGTMPGRVAPDGQPSPENLTTRRFDGGVVARIPAGTSRFLTLRSSGLGQWHDHQFGANAETDFHHTWFGEGALTGQSGRHVWVVGGAMQRDGYDAKECERVRLHLQRAWRVRSGRLLPHHLGDRLGKRARRFSQRVRELFQPAHFHAPASAARMDRAPFSGNRICRADAVHRGDRGGRADTRPSARGPRTGARTQRVVRHRVAARLDRVECQRLRIADTHPAVSARERDRQRRGPGPHSRLRIHRAVPRRRAWI